ncbi:hypothetical protein KKC83_00275 [Patescibacteria group bacterium]|nr:hypothetical protein [Candidatus Falkowbacteria bacterium]MBU3906108.1 hypothetical protein [Patescibacteria group bacterium]MBU4014693.1 hypothetical protein [Patescibacteria group bacterium]MBU4025974.1 hypothetical protein [Patescibacteria group bacterium]MBU4073156.1 hypothetical protein [Patescibacteria group bacterium]
MTFKLSILLIPYLLFLLLWLIFSLVAVYHMIKFGFKNFTTFFTTFIFVAVSLALLAVSYSFLMQIDWDTQITIFENAFNAKLF